MLNGIASFFGYLMNFIYNLVQNYGLAILIFTILVKLLLLPFTIKQQKSLEQAQEMQPLVQELQRKYGNDQQRFALEYQKLLKEKNMSAMSSMGCSGCLINFIQLPILLALFYMMGSPLTHIMKLDEDVINQYKDEVNSSRKAAVIAELDANADLYTDKELEDKKNAAEKATYVNERYYEIDIIKDKDLLDMDFFGINLCDLAINNKNNKALLVIPILSTLFTYLSLYISTNANKKKEIEKPKIGDDEIPMPDMRLMNIMMPLMMGYVAYSVPQGVGLYWATSNMLGVIQTVALRKVFKKEEKSDTIKNVEYKVVDDKKENKKETVKEKDIKVVENVEINAIKENTNNNSKTQKNNVAKKKHNKKKRR